jgi:hypothetical protein
MTDKGIYDCGYKEALHEIGHVTGLNHEHQRCDRDSYVAINLAMVDSDNIYAFDKLCGDLGNDLGLYDYTSVMHYRNNAFTSDGSVSMTSKNPNFTIGSVNPSNLSYGDIQNGVLQRYSGYFSCLFTSITCTYVSRDMNNYGLGYGINGVLGGRIRVWVKSDGGNVKINLTNSIIGTKTISTSNGGSTEGFIDNLSTYSYINMTFTPLDQNFRSLDVFFERY